MLNRLVAGRLDVALNAADVLGEFRATARRSRRSGAALSNPIFSGAARAEMAKALGTIGRAGGDAGPHGGAHRQRRAGAAASLLALRTIRGFRDGSVAAAAGQRR